MSKQENCNIGFIESCDVPSVYSNKQSYYEVLCYINYKLNELIDVYNKLELDYKTYVDSKLQDVKDYADEKDTLHSKEDRAYTDEKSLNTLNESKAYTNTVKETINKTLSQILDTISDMQLAINKVSSDLKVEATERERVDNNLELEINNTKMNITESINRLRQELSATDEFLLITINKNVQELKKWVKTYYEATYTVNNPWRGYSTDLQSCINDVYAVYRPLSMTCTQLDNIIPEITYIDNENLNCNDFDFNGLRVKQYLSDAYMHSPVSGRYLKLQDVIAEIMTQVVVSISTNTTQSGNRAYSKAYSDNIINVVDNGVMTTVDIDTLDERLALAQPYTDMKALDVYPQAVLQGKNMFTSNESVLRYEATYNA